MSLIQSIQQQMKDQWEPLGILNDPVTVSARILTTEEAIGKQDFKDFPLQKGKEKLMEASFKGSKGQAFTDQFNNFQGTLGEIISMDLNDNFKRAVFIAACNAVQHHLNKTGNTVHCRNDSVGRCAGKLAEYIKEHYGVPTITQIGYQPKMIASLSPIFPLRVIDLDQDNIGQTKHGILIEGPENTQDALNSAELILATGSTVVNDSLNNFILNDKPTIFYGTSVAATADILGLNRFCPESS